MLNLPSSVRVFLAVEPVDMRKSFDGLFAVAANRLGERPLDGALFVFANRRRSLIKVLFWDGSGLCILSKRLEKGGFTWPAASNCSGGKIALRREALAMLLAGIDLKDGMKKAWYER